MRPASLLPLSAMLCVVAAGCAELFGPGVPASAERMDPLPVYAEWWRLTEECSGLTGDFGAIRWYVVPGVDEFRRGGEQIAGMIVGDAIALAEGAMRTGSLVRHEMLHALARARGHPREYFVRRCAGTVACVGNCMAGGPPPAPDPEAVAIPEALLEVTAELVPAAPSMEEHGGAFRLVVTARNPLTQPAVVRLQPAGDAGPPGTFRCSYGYRGGSTYYSERAWFPEDTVFAPGETKRMIYDFFIDGTRWQEPFREGSYVFRGGFGDRMATPILVEIPVPPAP